MIVLDKQILCDQDQEAFSYLRLCFNDIFRLKGTSSFQLIQICKIIYFVQPILIRYEDYKIRATQKLW